MAIQIFQEKDEIFNEISENRADIYNYILLNPGTYLRKIFKDVGLAMGDTQYHLSVLEKKGYVKSRKVGKHRYYYPMLVNSGAEELILALLRQTTTRDILVYLIENIGATQSDLSNFKHFSKPTIYWYMKRLISSGLVVGFKEGNVIRYYVRDISSLTECIRKYMPDTWMNLASKFADMYLNITKKILSQKQSDNNNNNINTSSIIVNVCKR
jgi:predicted transcriptional regulator